MFSGTMTNEEIIRRGPPCGLPLALKRDYGDPSMPPHGISSQNEWLVVLNAGGGDPANLAYLVACGNEAPKLLAALAAARAENERLRAEVKSLRRYVSDKFDGAPPW